MTASPARIAASTAARARPSLGIAAPAAGGKASHKRLHQRPAAEHQIDALAAIGSASAAMQRAPAAARVPACRRARRCAGRAADRRLAEQRERGAPSTPDWRCSFRRSAARCRRAAELDQRAAPGGRLEFGERQRRQRQIGADQLGRRQHGERIEHQMPAGRADLVGELGAEDVGLDGRAVRMQRALDRRASALACSPNETMRATPASLARRLRCANCGLSRLSTAAPPGSRPRKISALASAILASVPKNSRCTGAIVVINATCGRTSRDSGVDLAGMIHADFEHGVARARRTARQRQRHAPVIVVGGDRGVGLAVLATARAAALPWCWSCRPSR